MKKFLSLALAMVMALSLVACGGGGAAPSGGEGGALCRNGRRIVRAIPHNAGFGVPRLPPFVGPEAEPIFFHYV